MQKRRPKGHAADPGRLLSLALRIAALALTAIIPFAAAQEPSAQTKESAGKVVQLLSGSGYQFKQYSPVVWGIDFKGDSLESFRVVITTQDSLVVIFTTVAKKSEIPLTVPLLTAMLRCNDTFDRVKLGLSDSGDAFVRMDVTARLLDAAEFKADLEQLSAAVDEAYKQIKPYLKK